VSASASPSRPPRPPLDPDQVAAATLACLPDITPRRLRALLDAFGGPLPALDAVLRDRVLRVLREVSPPRTHDALPTLVRLWASVGSDARLPHLLAARGTRVFVHGRPGYPIDEMPSPPPVLLAEGERAGACDGPRVAVVGTRSATPHGLADAREIGASLAAADCTVVSGLAIGIDAAAHEGALDAGGTVVGVLGTGLDVVYPRRHRALFARVREQGLLVSELGYGVGPRKSAFPVRNRIIAGLADAVVVVEATEKGGARITADQAMDYGRPVLAMPGSRRNPAAAGTNRLIYDGAQPLLAPDDVLVALGLTARARRGAAAARPEPVGDAARVLRACGGEPATLDQLASRTGLSLDALVGAVRTLEREGRMTRRDGCYWPLP
jgi:DNA processing protein